MADDTTASVITLHEVPRKRKDKTGAARAKAYRQRKRQGARSSPLPRPSLHLQNLRSPPEFPAADGTITELAMALPAVTPRPVTQLPAVTIRQDNKPVTPTRHTLAPALLSAAAFALAAVGITINGWFARSLGSSDVAGWLFLAVGVAADLVALVMPSAAAGLWHAGQRATALVGWAVWLVTFVFAVTAGIGLRIHRHQRRDPGGARHAVTPAMWAEAPRPR